MDRRHIKPHTDQIFVGAAGDQFNIFWNTRPTHGRHEGSWAVRVRTAPPVRRRRSGHGACGTVTQTAYVLIQCDLGAEEDLIRDIAGIADVREVRGTYGIYDIFCKIVSEDKESIDGVITARIRRMPRIRSATTLHWIPSQGGRD